MSFVLLVPKATQHLWGRNCRSLTTMQGGFPCSKTTQGPFLMGSLLMASAASSASAPLIPYFFFFSQFKNPLILLLLASALVSVITKEYEDAASITMASDICSLSPWWVAHVLHPHGGCHLSPIPALALCSQPCNPFSVPRPCSSWSLWPSSRWVVQSSAPWPWLAAQRPLL